MSSVTDVVKVRRCGSEWRLRRRIHSSLMRMAQCGLSCGVAVVLDCRQCGGVNRTTGLHHCLHVSKRWRLCGDVVCAARRQLLGWPAGGRTVVTRIAGAIAAGAIAAAAAAAQLPSPCCWWRRLNTEAVFESPRRMHAQCLAAVPAQPRPLSASPLHSSFGLACTQAVDCADPAFSAFTSQTDDSTAQPPKLLRIGPRL